MSRLMSRFDEVGLRNRRAVPLADIPSEPEEQFRRTVLNALRSGWRVSAFFGLAEGPGATRLVVFRFVFMWLVIRLIESKPG